MHALPAWYRLFPLLLALAWLPWTFVIASLAMRLASRGFRAGEPWYEQARAVFPAWTASNQVSIFAVLGAASSSMFCGAATPVPPSVVTITGVLAASLGSSLALSQMFKRVGLPTSSGQVLRGWVTLLLFQWLPLWVTVVTASVVRPIEEPTAVPRLVGSLVLLSLATSGIGIALLRLVGIARPANERLRRLTEAAAREAGHSPRFVLELDIGRANAFALTSLNGVLVTTPLRTALNDNELHAVLRHELGHLKEPRLVRFGRLLVATLIFSLAPVGFALRDPMLIAPFAVLALVVAVLMRRVTRRMEAHADDELGGDHAAYATALETIYRMNLLPAVMRVKGSHPDLYDRMTRAGHPPSWPKPAPPSRNTLATLLIVAGCVGPPLRVLGDAGETTTPANPAEVLLAREQDTALVRIARQYAETSRRDDARALLGGVAARNEPLRFEVLGANAELGFCAEASALVRPGDLMSDDPWAVWAMDRLSRCVPR